MEHLWQVQYSFLIPLLPLAGAIIAGFLGARYLKQQSHWPIWIGVGISAVISITLLFSTLGLWKHESPEPKGALDEVAPSMRTQAAAEHSAAPGSPLSQETSKLSGIKDYYSWI